METYYGRSMWYPYTYGYMYGERSECDCINYETIEMCQAKRMRYNCYDIKVNDIKVNRVNRVNRVNEVNKIKINKVN